MTDILHVISQQGLAFVILVGVLVALNQGLIITAGHFTDYKGQRDKLDEELRRELDEKDREIAAWQAISQFGPQSTKQLIEITKDVLNAAQSTRGPTP